MPCSTHGVAEDPRGTLHSARIGAPPGGRAHCVPEPHTAGRSLHEAAHWIHHGGPTTILEDNQSSIAMARNPQFHGRAKHIDIKHHFIRERVSDGLIELKYCPTNEMRRMGFSQSKSDPCIYVSGGKDPFYIGVYVDDLILAGNDKAKMKKVKEELSSKVELLFGHVHCPESGGEGDLDRTTCVHRKTPDQDGDE